jgi:hypothetical protein
MACWAGRLGDLQPINQSTIRPTNQFNSHVFSRSNLAPPGANLGREGHPFQGDQMRVFTGLAH